MTVDLGRLTVEAALRQSRLPDAQALPGKEVREVCVAKRVYALSELPELTLTKLFERSTCSPRARELVSELLQEYELPQMRP